MYLSRVVFKNSRAGHRALGRTIELDFDLPWASEISMRMVENQRWLHAQRIKRGSHEMHNVDYQSSYLRLLSSPGKDPLQIGVYRCLLKYKDKHDVDNVRSLISVWPHQLVEALLEDNQHFPKDVRELKLLAWDKISHVPWYTLPEQRLVHEDKMKRKWEDVMDAVPETYAELEDDQEEEIRDASSRIMLTKKIVVPIDTQKLRVNVQSQLDLLKRLTNVPLSRKRR
eukprot:GEMP01034528.1.p1 GENE.GEMP01034528.1~~GEMP01034528.1.p1  ORF type:complete len:227 (+),score=48.50 GEMP01034528.1:82-762(+)